MLKRYKWTWLLLSVMVIMAGYLLVQSLDIGKQKLPIIAEVQDFSLENVDGSTVMRDDTKGKVRLFYFFFTNCPDVCPVTTFMLSQVQDKLIKDGTFGKEAEFVSISFDPEVDTVEEMKKFGDKFNVDYNGWYFLRGDKQKIWDLAEKSFKIAIVGNNKDNYSHANLIALVDRDNQVRKLYNANDTENVTVDVLAQDIKDLAK
ncbi:SCO family protein [Paenibacillus sp. IHBB 10380]|uniref:SCO family protein n=1 Tax=Paenibacillus sp. IHBB 10380 TaxID=1566358 RepID=UPI0005CFCF53|nr:SCO family protein [Paenibacillus sp. IHBB 10380]AJS60075.1 electron transporter SenC [Paenibacillus sp. IHBB 10380]